MGDTVPAAGPKLAARIGQTSLAATVAMTIRARAMRAEGIEVISLAIGEPDFATPSHAIEAAHQAALRGETKYPPQDGTPALKKAVQQKFARENGLDYALDEILISNGGKQSIFDALIATLDPGDEVIVPAPYWGAYPLITKMLGGVPVEINCPQNNGFRLRPEALEAAITPRTKWLILNQPNNPTGAAYSREELGAIAAVMRRHPHVWIMSDEMYEHLIYEGGGHVSMAAAAADLRERILTISGVSKTYAMTGWRIGFSGGPRALIKAMMVMQGNATAGVSSVGQAAAAAALTGPQDMVAECAAAYRRRRDLVVATLQGAKGISCHKPEGAFYVYPNVAGVLGKTSETGKRIETDQDFCLALLEEKHVAVVQGSAFGMSPYVRISYATDDASLTEACKRIVEFCAALH